MERNRIIAIVCAVIAAALVIIAGKSCTDDAVRERGRKNSNTNTTAATVSPVPQATAAANNSYYETNEASAADIDPAETTVSYDLFGRIVTTEPETVVVGTATEGAESTETTPVETDVFGQPVTTLADPFGLDTAAETTTAPPRISGFNHGEYDDEGNPIPPKPTLPPDFVITIG